MNKFSILAAVATSLSAAAFASLGPSSSWQEIEQSSLYAAFPQVQFNGLSLPINAVCVNGKQLESLRPVTFCAQYATGAAHLGLRCLREGSQKLTTDITKTQLIPSGTVWGTYDPAFDPNMGSFFTSVDESTPLTVNVPVLQNAGARQSGLGRLVFVKAFAIPACQN